MTKLEKEEIREITQAMVSIKSNLDSGMACMRQDQMIPAGTHFDLAASAYQRCRHRLDRLIPK